MKIIIKEKFANPLKFHILAIYVWYAYIAIYVTIAIGYIHNGVKSVVSLNKVQDYLNNCSW